MHMLLVCVYDLIEFKNPRFSPSGSRKREAGVFKKPPLWAPYLKNLHFRCPKTAFLFERKAETDKKSRFPEMSGYVWMEPKIRDIAGKSESKFIVSEKGTTVAQWERKSVPPTLRSK